MSRANDNLRMVLILGSGPDVIRARSWPREPFTHIVAINNAWQIRTCWDYLIHPEDFPAEREPQSHDAETQTIVTAENYVPVQNRFGGFVYAGGTMAFTAGYWALGELKPDVIAFLGCDMNYDTKKTHFYGNGTADPLRDDITLQSLEAKSSRLMALAAMENCLCLNLSEQPNSRQVFPRIDLASLSGLTRQKHASMLETTQNGLDAASLHQAKQQEVDLGYFVPSGRYWEVESQFDARELAKLDDLWLASANLKDKARHIVRG